MLPSWQGTSAHAGRAPRAACALALLLLPACSLLWPQSSRAADSASKTLELHGRIGIPAQAILRGRRISLTLLQVGTPFSARAWADSKGRFRFRKLPPGTYSLSILIPGAGEIQSTVDVTSSFTDAKGRVEKQFVFDEESLARQARPPQQGLVSVRELSIPWRARREYEQARQDLQRQKVESATRHFQKAVGLAPQFMEALNSLGVLSFQQRDYIAAEAYFRKALETDEEAFEPLVNLGGTLLALGRLEEAIEVNSRAQRKRPGDALANAQLGLSYYLAGNDEEALNYLLLTEQLDPAHFTNPQLALARIYLRLSEEEAALEELQDFLERHPDSPEASRAKAMIGRIQQAMESDAALFSGRD